MHLRAFSCQVVPSRENPLHVVVGNISIQISQYKRCFLLCAGLFSKMAKISSYGLQKTSRVSTGLSTILLFVRIPRNPLNTQPEISNPLDYLSRRNRRSSSECPRVSLLFCFFPHRIALNNLPALILPVYCLLAILAPPHDVPILCRRKRSYMATKKGWAGRVDTSSFDLLHSTYPNHPDLYLSMVLFALPFLMIYGRVDASNLISSSSTSSGNFITSPKSAK